jgi:hypothetical protein
MRFFNSADSNSLEQTEAISTLKHLSCRKDSFHKLTQFSEENNVLDVPASTTKGVFSRDTLASST